MTIATASQDRVTPARASLFDLMTGQRQASVELHARLRACLSDEANRQMSPPPQSHTRRQQQLGKAYELRAQADAKLELLIEHFGGRQ
jgi:hypothetical protein